MQLRNRGDRSTPVLRQRCDWVGGECERHDGDGIGRRRVTHRGRSTFARPFELAWSAHAGRRIDEDDRRSSVEGRSKTGDVRPRKGPSQQHQRSHPQREQEELTQPTAARLLDRRLPQIAHRRELDNRLGPTVEQMNGDGHRGCHGADEKQRREEGDPEHQRVLPRVDR